MNEIINALNGVPHDFPERRMAYNDADGARLGDRQSVSANAMRMATIARNAAYAQIERRDVFTTPQASLIKATLGLPGTATADDTIEAARQLRAQAGDIPGAAAIARDDPAWAAACDAASLDPATAEVADVLTALTPASSNGPASAPEQPAPAADPQALSVAAPMLAALGLQQGARP